MGAQGAGRREEGGGGEAGCRGGIGRRGGTTAVPTHTLFDGIHRWGLGGGTRSPLFLLWFRLFSFISLVRITSSCDRRVWGGGGGPVEAGRRDARTADGKPGQKVRRHSLRMQGCMRVHMSKQKKNPRCRPMCFVIRQRTSSSHKPRRPRSPSHSLYRLGGVPIVVYRHD